jgi:hypothetical protein
MTRLFAAGSQSADGDGAFTHPIHAPFHNDVWIVLHVRHKPEFHHFESLQDALNFVRPVFGQPVLGQPMAIPSGRPHPGQSLGAAARSFGLPHDTTPANEGWMRSTRPEHPPILSRYSQYPLWQAIVQLPRLVL